MNANNINIIVRVFTRDKIIKMFVERFSNSIFNVYSYFMKFCMNLLFICQINFIRMLLTYLLNPFSISTLGPQ